MSESICNHCYYNNENYNNKPCSTCLNWVDGYLEAINYEPKKESIEEVHKQEMLEYIKSAIDYLELATNVIECDDNFNDGQSKKLDQIYSKSINAIKILKVFND